MTYTRLERLRALEVTFCVDEETADEVALTLRNLIIAKGDFDSSDITIDTAAAHMLREAIDALDREELTELALSESLCPLHLVDYAICFDDQDPECAAIRQIHPGHDT